MLSCMIVDDEPLAREGMANYVRETGFLQLCGTCGDPVTLMELLDKQPVDLLFLDIQMPKMSGIDFLKIRSSPPMVIITTAFPSYALEGFQLNVLDYLLKPVTFERFLKSAAKAKEYYQLLHKPAQPGASDHFFIKCGSKYEKIYFDDILYVEGMQNYVTIHTTRGKYITLLYLKNLEQNLDQQAFIRVHKSYIAAIGKIDSIEGGDIHIGGQRVPMSRNYREQVIEKVVANKLWDKIRFS
ncbi:LytTR family DNA-binding domain-containing protein [Chitinophaga horti]|uniref:LytTR family DNA-binding domain-containing protein n=1 Tax=Chitinophaga horti TaxID=2920382 RepID=A0ABY6IUE5_9BACT|nr:LytTR family DNA-binding domain-containing protein [Chitinophaga horti]UYQ90998.1 LytTR family DNA-binding domain-containing protein [Chitinophaga horti]